MPPCSEKERNNDVLEDHPKQNKDTNGIKKDNLNYMNKNDKMIRSSNISSMFVIATTVVNVCALSSVFIHVIPFCIQYQKLDGSHWLCQLWEFLVTTFPFITKISIDHTYATLGSALACYVGYILYAHRLLSQSAQTTMMMPHVPSQLPFLGTSLQFLSNSPWDLMQTWHRTYGPIYSFTLLGRTCIAVEKPEHVKVVLQSKIANVKKDVKFAYKPFLPILGKGIVTSEGRSWMKQRLKISNPLKTEILNIIPNATLQAVQRLYLKMQQPDQNLDMAEELRHLTLQVISNTFMGLTAQESDTTFAKMYLPIVEESNIRVWQPERDFMIFMPFFWRHRHNVKKLNHFMETLILTRWDAIHAGKTHNDMLDLVLRHYKKENPNEHKLSSDAISQIRDEFKTFMLAGHETSAAMMTWALYELIQNDDLMEKITEEAEKVFGKDVDWLADGIDETQLPSRDQLSQLVFSEACLKEALRKYSVVPTVQRRIVADIQVDEYTLKKGDSIMISIQSIHNNSKHWENPEVYEPSRFLSPNSEKIQPFTFLPFLEGPRNCLGQYLALLESKMVLSLIAQRFKLTLNEKEGGLKRLKKGSFEEPRHQYMVPVIPHSKLFVSIENKITK